jgi:hypothetical protein
VQKALFFHLIRHGFADIVKKFFPIGWIDRGCVGSPDQFIPFLVIDVVGLLYDRSRIVRLSVLQMAIDLAEQARIFIHIGIIRNRQLWKIIRTRQLTKKFPRKLP